MDVDLVNIIQSFQASQTTIILNMKLLSIIRSSSVILLA